MDTQTTHTPASRSQPADRWIGEHCDVLWRFALSRTRSRDAAEEVVQETLLAAIESYPRFAGDSSERTWLLGIAAHKIADRQRRAARTARREMSARDNRQDDLFTQRGAWREPPVAWSVAGTSSEERREVLAILERCLDELPPSLGEPVWLRDLLGVPSEHVCKALGVTATNVWTRVHRARSALRLCVERSLPSRRGAPA